MIPTHYNETATVSLRMVDITLTFSVISGLGELSGEDIELLYSLRTKLREVNPPAAKFVPVQRADEAFLQEVDVELKTSQVQFMLQALYGKLKCFGAGDMDHVMEIRGRLKAALEGAVKKAEPVEEVLEDPGD